MAEESTTVVSTDSVSTDTAPFTPEKKRRGPRPKSASLDAAIGDTSAKMPDSKKATRKTRVKRVKSAQPSLAGGGAAKKPRKMGAPTAIAETKSAADAGDEMADLLQLELENRNLRKLLAEKLRAENADLRKRLGDS